MAVGHASPGSERSNAMTTQNPVSSAPYVPVGQTRIRSSLLRSIWKHRMEYLLISPFFIIFAIFHGYPLLWSIWISLHRWQGIGVPRWFGTGNYERLLKDAQVIGALGNTLIFLVIMLPIIIFVTLILATILNSPQIRGRTVFRIMFFLPYITSAVIVAIIFQLLLNNNFGWINGILEFLGLPRVAWLTEAWPARTAIMLMIFWGAAGYNVLIMLGGLQGIPGELYDAASVDGASTVQRFFYVTIPMMRGVILFTAITSTIGLLNLFIQPWLLFSSTSGAGPNQATATLNTIQYSTAFQSARYGEAAALGFIIAVLVITVSLIQLRIGRMRD